MSASTRTARSRPRKRTLQSGDAIGTTFRITGKRFLPLLMLVLLTSLPFYAVIYLAETDATAFGGVDTTDNIAWLAQLMSQYIAAPLAAGMATKMVAGEFMKRSVGFSEAMGFGLARALPLIGLSLIYGLVVGLGFLLLIIPGIIFSVWFGVATPVLVVERRGVFDAMSRSKDLVTGNWWSVFAVFLVLGAIVFVAAAAVGAALALVLDGVEGESTFFLVISLIEISATTLMVVAPVVIYFKLRSGLEGTDVARLAALVDRIGADDGDEGEPAGA